MYYNDDFRNSDQYRYTNRDQLPHDDYAPDPNRVPVQPPVQPKKQGFFRRTAVKVTALILACAVAGGLAGWGGAAISGSGSSGKTTIQQSDRQPVTVQVKKVDGQTKMDPATVYASVVNSAVSINCSATSTNIFGQTTQSASSGSGFIITEDGYVVTNYHVVSGASSVQVTLYNGDTYDATVVGGDSDYDVAVLKINASGLQPVTLGESADVNVGDTVLAIGNPLGELTFSMSQGIVSSCDRAINVDGTPFNMIQVDCSINPGNSGGPLVNLYGEVVGIVSAKYSSYSSTTVEGLGFAIPISDVRSIITDIMENGAVTDKAYMAITAGTMNEQMAAQFNINVTEGVFVYSVVEGGAGDKAGLRLGDVITKMGDKTLTSRQDLSAAMKGYRAGDTVTLTVYRGGQYIEVELTFDAQPQNTGSEEDNTQSGGNNGGNGGNGGNGQMPGNWDNWQDFYNYFFGNRG
jgi:serine protease Do